MNNRVAKKLFGSRNFLLFTTMLLTALSAISCNLFSPNYTAAQEAKVTPIIPLLLDMKPYNFTVIREWLEWSRSSSPSPDTAYVAIIYCKFLELEGHNDWRVPTANELRSLVDMSKSPTISPEFKCLPAEYWADNFYSQTDWPFQGYQYVVDFKDGSSGYIVSYPLCEIGMTCVDVTRHVRCVRDLSFTFTVIRDGLEWIGNSYPILLDQDDATSLCNSLNFGGKSNWRLPTKDELKSLVVCSNGTATPLPDFTTCGVGYNSPTISSEFDFFKSGYWTSTLDSVDTGYGYSNNYRYYVDFNSGETNNHLVSQSNYCTQTYCEEKYYHAVRCVRNINP